MHMIMVPVDTHSRLEAERGKSPYETTVAMLNAKHAASRSRLDAECGKSPYETTVAAAVSKLGENQQAVCANPSNC